jgi:pimeloyl-ACP methyl ester carboxylesterase
MLPLEVEASCLHCHGNSSNLCKSCTVRQGATSKTRSLVQIHQYRLAALLSITTGLLHKRERGVSCAGSSFGGWQALHLAAEQPQLVAGLVLVAPALDITQQFWQGLSPQQQEQAQVMVRRNSGAGLV